MQSIDNDISWKEVEHKAPEWFRDAKFGLFFHWGVYSVPAWENEWYSRNMYAKGLSQNIHHEATYGKLSEFGYKDFIPMFTGEKFDPENWADLVVRSGAKYAGPVTEHADNFSMWDSQVNPVNSMRMGPKRDVTGECAKAFRNRGIKVLSTFHHQWLWGWFMSTDNEADVYDPANEKFYGPALPLETNRYAPYRLPDSTFNQNWKDKVCEVIDKYSPDIVYFDSRSNIIGEKYRLEMADYYYNKTGHKNGIITFKQEDFPSGTGVLDIECGRFAGSKPFCWQTDDRLEDNVTWCIVQNPKYKSAEKVIHQLCDVVSKNGNLLLNVGPKADGTFDEKAEAVLYEIGDWLKINGEAIYGSRPFKIAAEGKTTVTDTDYDVAHIETQLNKGLADDIECSAFSATDFRFTQKGAVTYVIALGWPNDRRYHIIALRAGENMDKITRVSLLGTDDEALPFNRTKDSLEVTLPECRPCKYAYVMKIE